MTTPALPTDAELVTGQPIKSDHVKALRDRKSNLDSPAFTGSPTAPTAAAGTSTTQVATTAFAAAADALLIPLTQKGAANGVATLDGTSRLTAAQVPTTVALLASPAFTGTPTAPTAAAGDSTTALATTAFATAADALRIPLTQRAAANGVATLDAATRLPVGQLPTVAARTDVAQTFNGGTQTFAMFGGGTGVNVTNQSDADFAIRVSAAGAADKVATLGPIVGNRVAFLVGGIERVQINPGAGGVALAVIGASSQTANILEARNSASTLLASITSSGGFAYSPVTQTTAPAAGAAAALPATPTGYADLTINGTVRKIAFY